MVPFAKRTGVITFCAFMLASCSSVPGFEPDVATGPAVQIISSNQIHACQFVADLKAESSHREEQDPLRAATQRAQLQAAAKGANAVFIQSVSTTTSTATTNGSLTTVNAVAYTCPQIASAR